MGPCEQRKRTPNSSPSVCISSFKFQLKSGNQKRRIVSSLMSRFLATKSKPFSSLLSPRHLTSPLKPPWAPSCQRFSTSAAGAAADRDRSSRKTLMYLVGVAAAMVGASYAAVPLYRRFCQATGYGGTVQRKETVEEKIARHSRDGTTTSREIIVQFNADVADGMPWRFIPTQREVFPT